MWKFKVSTQFENAENFKLSRRSLKPLGNWIKDDVLFKRYIKVDDMGHMEINLSIKNKNSITLKVGFSKLYHSN